MHFRSIIGGALAALLLSGTAALALEDGQAASSGFSFHLPKLGLPGVFGEHGTDKGRADSATVAQQTDPAGTTGVEDQMRQMNGKLEELNFQILQMQEQIRKQQEDNEFRFQQLEGTGGQGAPQKKSDAGTGGAGTGGAVAATAPPSGQGGDAAADTRRAATAPTTDQGGEVIVDSGNGEPGEVQGAPPKTFGTITVDKNGNVVNAEGDGGGQGNAQASAPARNAAPAADGSDNGGAVVAALPATDDPEELYRNSYQFILAGDYPTAEQGFRDHIARFPKDARASDAHYWLGEALLGQQKYRDAAEIFLAASKDYPKSKKAPDMLLKLGISLVGLKQTDVACATFNEIPKRYPDISSALKDRVKQEKALAAC